VKRVIFTSAVYWQDKEDVMDESYFEWCEYS
jgi:hypothetical protein